MFKKNPEKIINGTNNGADNAKAALTDGAAAEMNEPKETAALATKIIVKTQKANLISSLFNPDIQ